MSPTRELIERLRAADPHPDAERLSPSERDDADRMLARIVAEPPATERAARPRARARRWALAVAATASALAAGVVVVDLLDEDGAGPSIVTRAVAAVSDPGAIYREVSIDSLGPIGFYVEAWHGPGHTERAKIYELERGERGGLLIELAGRLRPLGHDEYRGKALIYNRSENQIIHGTFSQGRSTGEPATFNPSEDPGAGLRALERRGALTLEGRAEVDGEAAYRLVAVSDPVRYEYLVDADTYYPLLYREVRTDTGEVVKRTRYLSYEKLPDNAANRRLLQLEPHPGATHVDQDGQPLKD